MKKMQNKVAKNHVTSKRLLIGRDVTSRSRQDLLSSFPSGLYSRSISVLFCELQECLLARKRIIGVSYHCVRAQTRAHQEKYPCVCQLPRRNVGSGGCVAARREFPVLDYASFIVVKIISVWVMLYFKGLFYKWTLRNTINNRVMWHLANDSDTLYYFPRSSGLTDESTLQV